LAKRFQNPLDGLSGTGDDACDELDICPAIFGDCGEVSLIGDRQGAPSDEAVPSGDSAEGGRSNPPTSRDIANANGGSGDADIGVGGTL